MAAGLVIIFLLMYFQSSKKKEYESSLSRNWNFIEEKAKGFVDVLSTVKTVDDFTNLNSAARGMRDSIKDLREEEKSRSAPVGTGDLREKELAALDSIGKYLDLVAETADKSKVELFKEERHLIESRARKADADLNELLETADFLNVTISADFFNATGKMGDAINYRGEDADEHSAQALEALKTFMNADIKEINTEILWDMASSKRKAAIELLGGSRESMDGYRAAQWGTKVPADYFIDESSVNILSPGAAAVSVIVYVKDGSPMNAQVKLVLEPDGWKLDVYPFLGWVE
ncbi:MAG: hypothetical protein JXA49_09595 [Actinobacteria bacterium]|nr:hypothetical protein [Actinomycetota bacterium]